MDRQGAGESAAPASRYRLGLAGSEPHNSISAGFHTESLARYVIMRSH
jgi:hypothetical protein